MSASVPSEKKKTFGQVGRNIPFQFYRGQSAKVTSVVIDGEGRNDVSFLRILVARECPALRLGLEDETYQRVGVVGLVLLAARYGL